MSREVDTLILFVKKNGFEQAFDAFISVEMVEGSIQISNYRERNLRDPGG